MKIIKSRDYKRLSTKNKILSEREERYKVFIELSSEGIARFELENGEGINVNLAVEEQINCLFEKLIVAECNDVLARMYGYKNHEEFTGTRLKEILMRSKQENMEHMDSFINSGYRLTDAQTIEIDNKGNTKYFLNNLLGIVKDGKIYGVWVTQRDITDRKMAEDMVMSMNFELNKKNEQLLKINNDLDNFIYSVSHDLNAPLSNIEGLINVLKLNECYHQQEAKLMLDMMEVAVGRFKKTLKELAEVTKAQLAPVTDGNEIALSEMLGEVKSSVRNLIQDTRAVISEDFSSCEKIRFPKLGLQSIFYNLLSNAIKYRHPDRSPEIFIRSSKTNEFVVIEVEDNGIGVPAGEASQIFTMFKRLHSHVEGTGIGLYILKRIVENGGGRVEVESELNKGTCFRVFLKPDGLL